MARLTRLELADAGQPASFSFEDMLPYRERAVALVARAGTVPEELIALVRAEHPTEEQLARLTQLKQAMADRVMASPAADVYDEG